MSRITTQKGALSAFLLFFILFCCCVPTDLLAQVNRCTTMQGLQNRLQNDADYAQFHQQANAIPKLPLAQQRLIPCDGTNTIRVPIAFHFDAGFDCTDVNCILQEVQDQLDILNASYGDNTGTAAEAVCPAAYQDANGNSVASTGTCIEFYMPEPPAATGLESCDLPITIGQFVGGLNGGGSGAGAAWAGILNIFVTAGNCLGVADGIPGAANGDGVTVCQQAFGGLGGPCGQIDTDGTYNLGATLTHEIGHYLGLFHTHSEPFPGCTDNDVNAPGPYTVNDTPIMYDQYYGCPTGCVTNGNQGAGGGCGAVNDPIPTANFMAYTDDACMSMFTEDQAQVQNHWAEQLFGGSNFPDAAPGADINTSCGQSCTCPTVVTTPYANTDDHCFASGDYTLPTNFSSVVSDEPGNFVWSTGGYLSAGGNAVAGATYTPNAPISCAPEDETLYLNLTCAGDASVQLDAGTLTLTVYPDPTQFVTADLVAFTNGGCNGPTWVVTPGCESYVTVTQNGGPTFPVGSGSGAVNYDVNLNYPTACCSTPGAIIELEGTITQQNLNNGTAGQLCQNGNQPAVWQYTFTIPAAQNATDVNFTGLGSIMEVCIDLTLNGTSDAIIISLDSPDCGSYEWEDMWLGTAFNGGNNTGSTNICFTAGTPNGDFDGTFDGDDGTTGTFDNCLINGNMWDIWIADYNCYLNSPTGGTLNGATITFNDGNQPGNSTLCDFTATANYNCSSTCPTYTPPVLVGTGNCGDVLMPSGTLNPANATNVTYNWTLTGTASTITGGTTATPIITLQNNTCAAEAVDVNLTVTCTDDNSPIYTGTVGSVVINPCTITQACNDNDACTTGEMQEVSPDGTACSACTGGTTVNCDDGDVCNGLETCDAVNGCQPGTPLTCDDGDACNGVETCDAVNGCQPGTPLTCDDGNVCNGVETCDPVAGCQAGTPLNCDDGNVCNGLETCDATNGCQAGTPLTCDDGDPCNGVETCDAVNGCQPGTPTNCGNGVCDCNETNATCPADCPPCTMDSQCDDGDICNGLETCDPVNGCQLGIPLNCDDGNICNGVETCDPVAGCQAGTPLTCDDGNACNGLETCDTIAGCQAGIPLTCDDSNVCNGIETCNATTGCQAGTPLNCDDGNLCNGIETCDPTAGCIAGTPNHCGNGICDCGETNATCPGDCPTGCTSDAQCDDGDACTLDTCDASGNCINTPITCDDGNVCNGIETCNAVTGCVAGAPLNCNDNDPCNGVETCDPVLGCQPGTAPNTCGNGVCDCGEDDTTCPGDCPVGGCSMTAVVNDLNGIGGPFVSYFDVATIDVVNGTPPYNYAWSTIGFVRHGVIGLGKLRVLYADNATWTLTITDTDGCQIVLSNDGGVSMLEIKSYTVSHNSNCSNGGAPNGNIVLTMEGGTPPYAYNWSGPFNWSGTGQGTPAATNCPTGWYSVTVTDAAGDMTTGWYWIACAIPGRGKTTLADAGLSIYPNPTAQESTLAFSLATTSRATVAIYSIDGQRIGEVYNDIAEAGNVYQLPFQAGLLPAGVYIVRVSSENGEVYNQKLVITK